jgi:hypothetical protein
MAAMMTYLVKDCATKQIVRGHRFVTIRYFELNIRPGAPVSNLRVAHKEKYITRFAKFKGQHKTRIVGVIVEVECQLAKGV